MVRTLQAVAVGVMVAALVGVFYGAARESSSLMWPPMILGLAGTLVLVLGVAGEAWMLERKASMSKSAELRIENLEQRVEALQKAQAFQALR